MADSWRAARGLLRMKRGDLTWMRSLMGTTRLPVSGDLYSLDRRVYLQYQGRHCELQNGAIAGSMYARQLT